MKTTPQKTWFLVYADPILRAEGPTFYIEPDCYTQIRGVGLDVVFLSTLHEALTFLSQRVDLADDLSEVDLVENFTLHQAAAEGLEVCWSVEYQPRTSHYFVMKTDDTF